MNQEKQFNYEQFRQQLIQEIQLGRHNLTDIAGLLAPIVEDISQGSVQATSQQGCLAVSTSGDTSSANYPQRLNRHPGRINPPHAISLQQLQHEITALYEEGTSYQKIQQHLDLTYHKEVSIADLCRITDRLVPQVTAWQNRLLQPTYICLWIVQRETQIWQQNEILTVTLKTIVAVDLLGHCDILGYYTHQPDAIDFWPKFLRELKNRGVQDLLMICLDRPGRLKEVIHEAYPFVEIHGCMSQQIRCSLQQVHTDEKAFVRKALKAVYQAATLEQAGQQWQVVKEDWAKRYPLMIESWEQNWESLFSPMQYPPLIRQLTQGIPLLGSCYESLHQAAQYKGMQTNEAELLKALFVRSPVKASPQQQSVGNWDLLIQELAHLFDERVRKPLGVLGLG